MGVLAYIYVGFFCSFFVFGWVVAVANCAADKSFVTIKDSFWMKEHLQIFLFPRQLAPLLTAAALSCKPY